MKKILLILALLIGASACYAQSNVIRRQKTKTEQTQDKTRQQRETEAKKKQKEVEAKRRQEAEAKRQQQEEKGQQQEAEAKRRQEEEEKRQQQEAEAKRRQEAQKDPDVETFTVNGVTFEMVRVDGGSFQMGSNDGDSDEKPVHTESVGTFYIGKTEVTQELWQAVMGSNPSVFKGTNLPVEKVSWDDCQEFVDRLSRLTGKTFRLPTEVEWEYAARGGNKSRGYTYSGSNDVDRVVWYDDNSGSKTHPVAQKLDNELGIYDMSGNVWEWCSDKWCDNYSSPRNSSNRVFRGGSWGGSATYCRVASRLNLSPGLRSSDHGLRLAL